MLSADLRPLSEALRVRRLLWLRKQLFWERKKLTAFLQPSPRGSRVPKLTLKDIVKDLTY